VFVAEDEREGDAQHEGVRGKADPDAMPVADAADGIIIHDAAGDVRADPGAEAIGHEHEEALGAGADLDIRLAFDEQRPGDIEEVEGHAIDDHGQDQEGQAAAGVAKSKETETEDPGEDAHDDDLFDAKPPEEERNGENEERLGDLRNGDDQYGMPNAKRASVLGYFGEIVDEAVGKCIADLQGEAEEHGIDEEDQHLLVLEEHKCVETERGGKAPPGGIGHGGAGGHGEGIDAEEDAGGCADVELGGLQSVSLQIDPPHGAYKPDGPPNADGRKVLDGIVIPLFQDDKGHGVVERDGGHEEGGVKEHRDIKRIEVVKGGGPEQTAGAHDVADAQDPFHIDPAVGNNSEERRGKDGGDAHAAIDGADLGAGEMKDVEHIAAERDEPGAPDEEFEEVHYGEAEFDTHAMDLYMCYRFETDLVRTNPEDTVFLWYEYDDKRIGYLTEDRRPGAGADWREDQRGGADNPGRGGPAFRERFPTLPGRPGQWGAGAPAWE